MFNTGTFAWSTFKECFNTFLLYILTVNIFYLCFCSYFPSLQHFEDKDMKTGRLNIKTAGILWTSVVSWCMTCCIFQ